jgi:hypothetical protein
LRSVALLKALCRTFSRLRENVGTATISYLTLDHKT